MKKRFLAVFLALALCMGLATPAFAAENSVPAFTDVPSWCAKEAQWAAEQGITNGAGSATLFAPNEICAHEEILTFLWRAEGKPAAETTFPRTLLASWYQDAIN